MSGDNSIINLGELSRPATVLIEKISEAVGGIFRPFQIKRVAKAEAEGQKIRALAELEISDIQQRGLARLIHEEGRKQENIERITAQSFQDLREDAKPENIPPDWIAHFFDKCKLISDGELQSLWAKLLASEANKPGAISKRTIHLVSSLEKMDAQMFTNLCGFVWDWGRLAPLVYDVTNEIYGQKSVYFSSLTHLDEIGVLTFDNFVNFEGKGMRKVETFYYFGTPVRVEFSKEKDNYFQLGHVLLSQVGRELAPISGAEPVQGFLEYVVGVWKGFGYTVTIQSPG